MKRILSIVFFLASIATYGQQTDAQNTTQFNIIRNETSPGGNTKTRIADAYEALNQSKMSRAEAITAASTDTYTATLLNASTFDYTKNPILWVTFTNANTVTTPTLNPSSKGAKTLVKNDGTALAVGDIKAGTTHLLYYNGTNFKVMTLAATSKSDIGLGNVDNTSDANKPVSTAQQTALDLKANLISPVLVTPNIGTPSSGVLTNTTGLPISTGVSGLGTGVATFLATPTSANLASALTNETGSGAAVFATSPTFVTPILGTPTSGVATNITGLPLSTGVTGNLPVTNLNSGTSASSSTFWRGDGTWAAAGGSGLTVGSTTIASGTTTKVLYNNAGNLGEYTVSGTGNVAMTASPSLSGTPTSGSPVSESFSGRALVARGNSVTLGIPGVSNSTVFAFPVALANLYNLSLNTAGVNGQTAQTYASSGLAGIPTYSAGSHKYLVLEWGINDIGAGRTSVQFTGDMNTIITNATGKGWPAASIIVLSIPGSWTSGNPTTIATFNSALSTLCTSLSVNYVDVTTPFSATEPGAAAYTYEGIHPNDQGAALMAYTIYTQIKPNYVTTGNALAVNGVASFNNIKYYGAPFITKPHLMGIDSTGAIGIANSLRRGTRVDELFIVNGNLKQLNVVDPTGVAINDFVLNNDMKIWSTLSSNINGYIQPMASGTGAMNISNSYGGINFLVAAAGGTPVNKITIDNTGNLLFADGTSTLSSTLPASGGVLGSYKPVDASGNSIFSMNYTAGHYKFLGWDGTGGKNLNQTYLDMSSVGGAVFTLPLKSTSFTTAYVAKTALYTLTSTDYTVEVTSGTHTQTLPTAVGITGRIYTITNSGTGVVTIGTTSSQTFVNVTATPTTLTVAQFHTYVVQSNGANWLVISSF